MSGGGSQTTTSSTTVPPQFLSAYQNTVSRAQNVASTPYQSYNGQLVADFTPQQTQAQEAVSNVQTSYQPDLQAAQNNINASTLPLWAQTMQSGVSPGAGIAGYNPNFQSSMLQTGVSPSSGIAGYNPNFQGSMLQSGVSPSAGIAGYEQNFYGNAPGVNAQTISQYENPFQSQVTNATEAQIANTDAQQQAQLSGNAASAGAFGGDRMGVAQGILGGQQAVANNATLAGLNTTSYDTALQTAEGQQSAAINAAEASQQIGNQEFNTQQAAQLGATEAGAQLANQQFDTQQAAQLGATEAGSQLANSEFNTQQQAQLGANEANSWLYSQAGYADSNLANENNNLGLTDASALAQSGLTQQQQQQAELNTAYEQWQAQQAFPYQQTGWLGNIVEGIGSNVGGSSTTSTSQSNRGGRIGRASGGGINWTDVGAGIAAAMGLDTAFGAGKGGLSSGFARGGIVGRDAFGGSTPVDNFANEFDPQALPGAVDFWNNDTLANSVLGAINHTYGLNLKRGGIVPAHYDGGGGISILGDTPDPANSWIPTASGGGGGGIRRGPPSPGGAPPMQQNPLNNPATDIGALSGGVSLYNNLGGGSLFGSAGSAPALTAAAGNDIPATTIGGIASGTPEMSMGAATPGFMSGVGDTIATGASDAASAIGAGADAVGNGIAAGAGALGDAAASAGTWLLSLLAFLKDGGRVGEEPQHKAGGGIVVPFPQDRVHRAKGGIVAGNSGEMPYTMAPPVPLQATGTNGGGIAGYMPPGNSPSMYAGGGSGGSISGTGIAGGMMPAGLHRGGPAMGRHRHGTPIAQTPEATAAGVLLPPTTHAMNRGGIVPDFDDGGATDAPPAENDDWAGPGVTPSADDTANWNAPAAQQGSGSGIAATSSFVPEKPSLWPAAVAGIAGAVLGRHTNNWRNAAEGVLTGLNTYQGEEKSYQTQREKAADLDQQAKQLADAALYHKQQIALETQKANDEASFHTGSLANDAARTAAQNSYWQVSGAADTTRAGADVMNAQTNAAKANQDHYISLGQVDDQGRPLLMDTKTGQTIASPFAAGVHPDVTARIQAETQLRNQAMTLAQSDKDKALVERADASTLYAATNLVRSDPTGRTTLSDAFNQVRQYAPRTAAPSPQSSSAPPTAAAPAPTPPPWQRTWQTPSSGQ